MVDYASDFVFEGDFEDDERDERYCDEEEEHEFTFETEATDQPDSGISPRRKSIRYTPYESYRARLRREQEGQAANREQEKREEFRKLMGMKLRKDIDGESIATELSCEDVEGDKKRDQEVSSEDASDTFLKGIETGDSQLGLSILDDDVPASEESEILLKFSDLPVSMYKDDGIQKFFDLAREMELRPIGSIREMLQTDTLNLGYYGIDPRIVQVFSKAIETNTSIQIIDLTDNWLTPDACYYLGELLLSNDIISQLDLTGCRIGPEGAKNLERGIAAAPVLVQLNLSRCDLGDDGLRSIASAIGDSRSLASVNLSRNKLADRETEYLRKMLMSTDCLKRLDVSWNSLGEPKFAESFFLGLSSNKSLEYLNMSGNGLGERSTQFLALYLADSGNLRELDLSDNRFDGTDAIQIATALSKNNGGLELLRLGNNPLEASGVLALVNALTPKNSPNSQLNVLDLKNSWAAKDVEPSLKIIQSERPSLSINLAGILSNYKLLGPDTKKIFLRRANYEAANPKKKKQSRDFGHFVLTLKDEVVPSEFFRKSVKNFKLKLSRSLIDEISKAFETEPGQIDLKSLKECYLKEYPETQPPPEKYGEKKKKSVDRKSR